jgi:hypothetical protein
MRTVTDFVSDTRLAGKTREEVRCIALSTRWAGQLPTVLEEYDRAKLNQKLTGILPNIPQILKEHRKATQS